MHSDHESDPPPDVDAKTNCPHCGGEVYALNRYCKHCRRDMTEAVADARSVLQ